MPISDSFQLTDSQYIPQFVGTPIQTVEKVGDALQERHYENIAKARQLELLSMQQRANAESDADKAYIDSQVGGVQEALSEMAKNGAENATSKISALANTYLGNEGLINIQKSIDARSREKAITEKLQAEGKTPIMNQRAYDEFRSRGTYNPNSGKWEPYTPSTQQQLDYIKKQDELFSPLQASSWQTGLKGDLDTTLRNMGYKGGTDELANMPVFLQTKRISELSEKRIHEFLDEQGGWESYKKTPEYAQQKNILGASDEEIYQDVLSRGLAKTESHIQKEWERNYGFDFKAAQKGEEGLIPPTGEQMGNEPIEVTDSVGDISHFEPDNRRGAASIGTSTGFAGGAGPGPVATGGSQGPEYYGAVKGMKAERWKGFNDYAKAGAEIYGGDATKYANLTEASDPALLKEAAQYAKQYQTLVHDRQVFNIKDVTFTKREGEEGRSNASDITTDVVNNIRSRAIYDPISKKLVPITNQKGDKYSDDFVDVIGKPGNITVTGSLDPQNFLAKKLKNPEFSDAYVATITDPDDPEKTREVFITRRKYDPSQNKYTKYNREVNNIYSTVNVEPGVEKTLTIAGAKVKAKELVGKQLEAATADMDENSKAIIAGYEMPILADVPGEGVQIFNGAKHLADYMINRK